MSHDLQAVERRISSLLKTRQFAAAHQELSNLVQQVPRSWEAWRLKGVAEINLERHADARRSLSRALKLSRRSPSVLANLASLEQAEGKLRKAEQLLAEALRRAPTEASLHYNYGRLKRELNDFDAAETHLGKACELAAEKPDYRLWFGHVLRARGKLEQAAAQYRLAMDGTMPGTAAWGLAGLRSIALTQADAERFRRTCEDELEAREERACAAFALAHALDRQDALAEAAEWFRRANAMANRPTGAAAWAEDMAATIEDRYTGHDFGAAQGSPGPVFIVSMPRSGSTLVESMLGAASDLTAAGETDFVDRWVRSEAGSTRPAVDALPLTSAHAGELRTWYERAAGRAGFKLQGMLDKSLGTLWWVGLIAEALPTARFLFLEREPFNTRMGCYALYFAHGHEYTFSEKELKRWHVAYARTARFWQSVLGGRSSALGLERLVDDPARELQRVCADLSLTYDEAMIGRFAERRVIRSASAGQIRGGVSSDQAGHWTRFKPWFTELE